MNKSLIILLIIVFGTTSYGQFYHDTTGNLEITNSGQATFNVPIALPPSINNVGPVLNLNYVSGQQGGLVGQGWNINNISSISRISTRLDIDGFRDGVDFDDNDKLALDGQRLLLKSGIYLSSGSFYETEVQSNLKIEYSSKRGVQFFMTTAPDGSRTWYGNFGGTNATDPTIYYIVRFEDVSGNFMTYHYSNPIANSLYLNEVRFSANKFSNPTPINKIVFSYKNANRIENGFINALKVEKKLMLNKIEVFTNNLKFKGYEIKHTADSYGYERVTSIQESNGVGELANPITFDYLTSGIGAVENTTTYTDALNLTTAPQMSGDFDGDGRLDFADQSKIYTKLLSGAGIVNNLPFSSSARQKFTAITLTNNKLNQNQSIVFADEKIEDINFKVYNVINNEVVNSFDKIIKFDNFGKCEDICTKFEYDLDGNILVGDKYPASKCTADKFIKTSNKYNEGDFNGDGISEVLIFSYDQTRTYAESMEGPGISTEPDDINPDNPNPESEPIRGCKWFYDTSPEFTSVKLLDLNENSSTEEGTTGFTNIDNYNLLIGQHRYFMDFNIDGKTDILVVNNDKTYRVVSFVQIEIAPWVTLEVIGVGIITDFSPTKQILFGDFNGDSKPDIMLPDADGKGCEECNDWHIYYSNPNPNGGEFFKKDTYKIAPYRPYTTDDYKESWHQSSYYALDTNKDGKSDLVRVWNRLYQPSFFWDPKNQDSEWAVSNYVNNIGLNNQFTFDYYSPWEHTSDDNSRPISLSANYRYHNIESELLVIRYHPGNSFPKTVTYIDFKKDVSKENMLFSVSQSNGAIKNTVNYLPMQPSVFNESFGQPLDFYSSNNSLTYPNLEMKQLSNNLLVSSVVNYSLNVSKTQDFKYYGYAINLSGVGPIGFSKTARSAWYTSESNSKTWSLQQTNPLLRGANILSQTILLPKRDSFDFSVNYGSNIVSATEYSYTQNTDPATKRYTVLLNKQKNIDFLTKIVTEKVNNSTHQTIFYHCELQQIHF